MKIHILNILFLVIWHQNINDTKTNELIINIKQTDQQQSLLKLPINDNDDIINLLNNLDKNNNGNMLIHRLYAKQYIEILQQEYNVAKFNDQTNIKKQIIQLSLQYNILTNFTSFIAIDDHNQ